VWIGKKRASVTAGYALGGSSPPVVGADFVQEDRPSGRADWAQNRALDPAGFGERSEPGGTVLTVLEPPPDAEW
jgi:hypothetical protein